MEKFYRVDKNHIIYGLYEGYEDMSHKVNEAFKEYSKEIGLEAQEYYQTVDRLSVVPAKNDLEKFKGHFISASPGRFKKTSEYSKRWVRKCEELKLKNPERPRLWMFFDTYGRSRSNLLKIDGILYADFESEAKFAAPDGFIEIPGSEFYKAIEEHNDKLG